MKRRRLAVLVTPLVALLVLFGSASPAAAVTVQEKLAVMYDWSQPTSTSYNAWNSGRLNQSAWYAYGFDWSTDYCSSSPDQPLGFDFRLSCYRHDFGYRNYKAMGLFLENKSRIDNAFYYDLKAKCATYNVFVRPSCLSLAWTYYQAVVAFGALSVSQTDLDRAASLKAQGERAAALAYAEGNAA